MKIEKHRSGMRPPRINRVKNEWIERGRENHPLVDELELIGAVSMLQALPKCPGKRAQADDSTTLQLTHVLRRFKIVEAGGDLRSPSDS
jgi:hypothetical protein